MTAPPEIPNTKAPAPRRGPAFDVTGATLAHVARLELGLQSVENENLALHERCDALERDRSIRSEQLYRVIALLDDVIGSRASAPVRQAASDLAMELTGPQPG